MAGEHREHADADDSAVGAEINTLRKYIVEMMHSEMELVEGIKQKEESLATVNVRVRQSKELIAQEQLRYEELKKALAADTKQLELLEAKQFVGDARHRQYLDAVVQHESEVHSLQRTYQQQRAVMISLRRQMKEAETCLKTLSFLDRSLDNDTQRVRNDSGERTSMMKSQTDLQKLYAKMRYIQQYRVQMEEESEALCNKREAIEPEVAKLQAQVQKLRDALLLQSKETEFLCSRLRQESYSLSQQNVRLQGKLKAKSKEFRSKTRNEISSLKYKIACITSELERGRMTNEDMLSTMNVLSDAREALVLRENSLANQIAVEEKAIAELSEAVAAYAHGEGRFSMVHLQNEIAARHEDIQASNKKLEEKQRALTQWEDEQAKLYATVREINAQVEELGAARLDENISSLASTIQRQQAQRDDLRECIHNSKKASKVTQTNCRKLKRKHKGLAKVQSKLRRQKDVLRKEGGKVSRELSQREHLAQVLHEGIEYGMECVRQLEENKETLGQKQQRMELELYAQEQAWQARCKDKEAGFKAEVTSWDTKIDALEKQLGAF